MAEEQIELGRLFHAFPVQVEQAEDVAWQSALRAYFGVSGQDMHGHYIAPEEERTFVHRHKGGGRAHEHEQEGQPG